MSGIFGIIHSDGKPVAAADLELIRDAMRHRGPDGSDIWVDRSVGLGQLMLQSTPESQHEYLPWKDPESGLVITADARLYNRDELTKKLAVGARHAGEDLLAQTRPHGGLLQTSLELSDSGLILAAYKRWGDDCVDHLLGDFAFAIWDSGKRRLFCARDHMGGAPFCFVQKEHYFAFSSEPEALLHLPGVSAQPNDNLIATVLVPHFENRDDHRTWHRDIDALMPAHALSVTSGGRMKIRRYWEFNPGGYARYASHQESLEHFTEIFGEAVSCRLRSLGNIAAMLSGGLDSAGLGAMICRQPLGPSGREIHTYSAIADDPGSSIETRAILSMVESLGVKPHYSSIPSLRGMVSIDDLTEAAWEFAHPVDNSILLPAMMCLAAKRDGNRVVLEGGCGDIAMRFPRQYIATFLRRGKLMSAWNECVAASKNNVYLQGTPAGTLMKQGIWHAFAPRGLRKYRLRRKQQKSGEVIGSSLIKSEFADNIQLVERLEAQWERQQASSLESLSRTQTDRSLAHILWGLAGYGRIAARYGVEVRDPWADKRLFEFFVHLPPEHLIQDGWTKIPVRKSFEQDLAPEVLWRRDKEHLGWKYIIRLMAESNSLVRRLMKNELESLEEFVDLAAAQALVDRWSDTGETSPTLEVFELTTMILWLRRIKSLR